MNVKKTKSSKKIVLKITMSMTMIVTIEIESYQRRSDKLPKGGALRQFPCCR